MTIDISANDRMINYFGRWDFNEQGVAKIGWGSAYIKMRFYGTSLAIKLRDAADNWWQFSIDGGVVKKFQPLTPITNLAENLAAGEHDLMLFRRTEGNLGISEFSGIILAAGGRLIEHDFSQERRIEFVGDSIVCGYVNDGPGWTNQDSYRAFSVKLARLLMADWNCIAISGVGVVHNYDEQWPPCMPHMQDYYARTYKNELLPLWQFSHWQPQVSIIAMGTNDFTDILRAPTKEEFSIGYRKLIDEVRLHNPDTKIICLEPIPVWAGMLCRDWIKQVVLDCIAGGDSAVHYLSINEPAALLEEKHYVGDGTHPNILGGKILADFLRERVAHIAGWK